LAVWSLLLVGQAAPLHAQGCLVIPTPPAQSGVINTYFPGIGTVAAGVTTLNINANAATGVGANIVAGDMLVVMQMQDADIDSGNTVDYGDGAGGNPGFGQTALNDSGRYEYVIAGNSVAVGSGASVPLQIAGAAPATNGLLFAYETAAIPGGNGPTIGQRSFQVIKVAAFQNVTLAGVTATPWNGVTGGVVVVDASGTLTINGTGVDASGDGFRGAPGQQLAGQANNVANTDYRRTSATTAHGLKGEGIACTPANFTGIGATRGCPTSANNNANGDRARGGPGNAGGGGTDGDPAANDENSGGGGGGNGGPGGRGGNSWNSNLTVGGLGGALFPAVVSRLAMGGGGGAGTRNNTPGVPNASGGASGGGIVLIRAGQVVAGTGTPTIAANGAPGVDADNDGGGGGGAGGTVLVVTQTGSLAAIRVLAQGGKGGDSWITQPPGGNPGNRHGPGGGGGGGVYFLSSNPAATSSVAGGPSGVTTNILDPYGSSGGTGSTNILGNVTIFDVPGVVPCITVLRGTIAGLRADPAGLVEFVTDHQRGTVAFNVHGSAEERLGGPLVRLNDAPIVSPVPDSMMPIFYRAETAPFDFPFLVIEEIERGGHRRLLGPFPISDVPLREEFERLEKQLPESEVREVGRARIALGHRAAPERARDVRLAIRAAEARSRAAQSFTAVKIEMGRAGLARVAVADLLPWGFPSGPVHPRVVRLTNLGLPVPYQVEMGTGGDPEALTFAAEEMSTDYSGRNVYVLSWGAPTPVATVALTRSELPRVPGMVRVERNQYYAAYLPQDADPWIWDLVISGTPAGPWPFDLPGLVPGQSGTARMRLRVVGGSDHTHSLTAYINGVPFGHLVFTGQKSALLKGRLPAGTLLPAGNVLTLDYTTTGGPEGPGLVYLDCLDVGVAVSITDVVAPDRIAGYDPTLPSLQGVDYTVVTHALFQPEADAIAALKQAQGFTTAVVDVERAYDRFSGGLVEPNAVRALLRPHLLDHGPRYVLLVGDDTYDPRDFSGTGGVSFIPSLMGWDGQFGRVPSENRYADQDGDSRPDLAIGRLPVSTSAQADVMVQKIADVLGEGRPVLAVDNRGLDDLSFRAEARSIARFLNARPVWADIEAQGIAQARQTLLQSLQSGAMTASYFGHAGQSWWADEHLLGPADMAALEGTGSPTVVLAWTCNAQWYQNHLEPSLGEDLVLVPGGGAAAAFGPAGMTAPVLQAALYARLYPNLAAGMTLGEAVRRAKADAVAADPATLPAVEGFNLLGDPALALPGYTLSR
jgi:hypothetical protein